MWTFPYLKESQRDQLAGILSDIPDSACAIYDALDWKPDKRKKKLYAPSPPRIPFWK